MSKEEDNNVIAATGSRDALRQVVKRKQRGYTPKNPATMAEQIVSPPAKRMKLVQPEDHINHNDIIWQVQDEEEEYTTLFVSTGLLSDSLTDHVPIIPDNTVCNPANNPFASSTSRDVNCSGTKAVYRQIEDLKQEPVKGISNMQPDGIETSLRDYRFQNIDDQTVTLLPSFKSVRGLDSIVVPRKRVRRVHTGEKTFPCPLCSRSFKYPVDRNTHIVTQACTRAKQHIQQTPLNGQWQCLTCNDNKVFHTKGSAECHARLHERGKGMICPVCNENFYGVKGNVLVQHVKKQHRDYLPSFGL